MSAEGLSTESDNLDDLNKLEAAWVHAVLNTDWWHPTETHYTMHHAHRFYTSGYEAGFEHGKEHGVFEGRALGQAKGFETFEELFYYAGQARFWQAVAQHDVKKQK